MRKFLLSILCLSLVISVSAQKVYFIYLQSEKGQPFFVKLNDKVLSSTASGYLIIPKLLDSTYQLSIGTLQKEVPEQNFSVSISKKDHGYLFKNFGEQGWGLFDLQSLAVNMASSKKNIPAIKAEEKDVSAFTDILSKAADDPTLKEKPVLPEQPKRNEAVIASETVKKVEPVSAEKEVPPVKQNETAETIREKELSLKMNSESAIQKDTAKEIQPVLTVEKETPGIKPMVVNDEEQQAIYKPSMIIKKYETTTTEGLGLVFIDDFNNGYKDTISLIIPDPSKNEKNPQNSKEELKFLEIITPVEQGINADKKITDSDDQAMKNNKPVTVKTCLNVADETDFYILRKRMAAALTDKEMLNEASEYFKLKCFTTAQIKNLSTLFLKEEGKYNFFESAHPFISDPTNFNSLETEFKEANYVKKFKTLLLN